MNRVQQQGGNLFSGAPVSVGTVALMLVVFLTDLLLKNIDLYGLCTFTTQQAILEGELWRILTGPLVNGSGSDLFGTLIFFVLLAPLLERSIPRKEFVKLLLLSICSVYIVWTGLSLANVIEGSRLMPISGGVGMKAGVVAGIYRVLGNQSVSLLISNRPFLIKNIILVFIVIWLGVTVLDSSKAGNTGLYLVWQLVAITGAIAGWWITRSPYMGLSFGSGNKKKTKAKRKKKSYQSKVKPRTSIDRSDSEVDKILDKISDKGFQSLTEQERKVLEKASQSS